MSKKVNKKVVFNLGDEAGLKNLLGDVFNIIWIRAGLATDLEVNLNQIDEQPCAIITDVHFNSSSAFGIEVIKICKKKYKKVPVIVWTLSEPEYYKDIFLKNGADAFIQKHTQDKNLETGLLATIQKLCL